MRRSRLAARSASIALAAFGALAAAALAQTTKPAPQDSGASMVKPPKAAPGAGSSSNPDNPDNMPIKRPRKPTNDKMMHEPPASSANAK